MEENKIFAIRPKNRPKVVAPGISHIPHEILLEILTRVPSAKSLLRFRCVSKSFCSLISEPSFIEAHQKGSVSHLLVNLPGYDTRNTFINLDKKETYKYNQLAFSIFQYLSEPCFLQLNYLESINGLICLWNDNEDFAICNPFTKQHVFLPKLMTKKVDLTCCSLGFDPTTKKHKVLLAQRVSDRTPHWNIFTLGMDKSWREIHYYARFFPMINNCVHIDGFIYCVNFYDFFVHDNHIAAFNVGQENFRMISFPRGVKLSLSLFSPTIVEIKGEVALLDHKSFKRDGKIFVYILSNSSCETDGTEWVKEQTFEQPLEFKQNVKTVFHYRFTSTTKGEIVLVPSFKINSSCLEYMYSFLFFYDTRRKEWIKFELRGVGQQNFGEMQNSVWRNLVETIWSLK